MTAQQTYGKWNAQEHARKDAEIAELRAALVACVDHWRDTEVPCPPALHDLVTTALGGIIEQRAVGEGG